MLLQHWAPAGLNANFSCPPTPPYFGRPCWFFLWGEPPEHLWMPLAGHIRLESLLAGHFAGLCLCVASLAYVCHKYTRVRRLPLVTK